MEGLMRVPVRVFGVPCGPSGTASFEACEVIETRNQDGVKTAPRRWGARKLKMAPPSECS
eukprot:2963772-Pyramimonas_sp.AAC.1